MNRARANWCIVLGQSRDVYESITRRERNDWIDEWNELNKRR